jgi:hypothetical protein
MQIPDTTKLTPQEIGPTTLEEMRAAYFARKARRDAAAAAAAREASALPPPPSPVINLTAEIEARKLAEERRRKLAEEEAAVVRQAHEEKRHLLRKDDVRVIQQAVADHFGVTWMELMSKRRDSKLVKPRYVALYLCRRLTLYSLPQIARCFLRDHTTVLYAMKKMEARPDDPDVAALLERLRKVEPDAQTT